MDSSEDLSGNANKMMLEKLITLRSRGIIIMNLILIKAKSMCLKTFNLLLFYIYFFLSKNTII